MAGSGETLSHTSDAIDCQVEGTDQRHYAPVLSEHYALRAVAVRRVRELALAVLEGSAVGAGGLDRGTRP
jgi:hypothetical protein